ncbi:MAG: hypothetical protein ACTSP3_05885 [Candidatus Heimdallarchaeaceae archaeon]
MLNITKYEKYNKIRKGKKLSMFALQTFLDLVTIDLMSIELEHTELLNKILEKLKISQLLPNGEKFSADIKLSSSSVGSELWLINEYEFHRNKNRIVQLNTLFEIYLYKFSKLWLEQRPGTLDDCKVSLKEVKEEDKLTIISSKIDAYIHDLLFGEYSEIFKKMKKRLNANISISAAELEKLNEFYAIRNLIVHSNGIINLKFKKKVPKDKYEVGKRIDLNLKYIEDIEFFLATILLRIDKYLLKNFPDFVVDNLSGLENVEIQYYTT